MNKSIKLIWDFRGMDAKPTAKHHWMHLNDFMDAHPYPLRIIGHEDIDDWHAIAYMVVYEEDLIKFRDLLRPHRAEVYPA